MIMTMCDAKGYIYLNKPVQKTSFIYSLTNLPAYAYF